MKTVLEQLHDAAINVFEPNLVKASESYGKIPQEFTVTVLNVPKKQLHDKAVLDVFERELTDAIKSLNLEIVTLTVGYERKMLRFDITIRK